MEVRMTRYPKLGETVALTTVPTRSRRGIYPRYFVMKDDRDEMIGCASSLWCLLDLTDRRMAVSEEVSKGLPENRDFEPPIGLPGAVEHLDVEPETALFVPQYTDLDVNRHVNNTKYVDWCCNALGIDLMTECALRHFRVNYNAEIRPGQQIVTELRRDGDRFSYCGREGDIRHFEIDGELMPR